MDYPDIIPTSPSCRRVKGSRRVGPGSFFVFLGCGFSFLGFCYVYSFEDAFSFVFLFEEGVLV